MVFLQPGRQLASDKMADRICSNDYFGDSGGFCLVETYIEDVPTRKNNFSAIEEHCTTYLSQHFIMR